MSRRLFFAGFGVACASWLSCLVMPEGAWGQSCSVACPRRAVTEQIVRESILKAVTERLDRSCFADTRTSVRMTLVARTPEEEIRLPLDALLNGLSIEDEEHLPGLAFGVRGDASVSFSANCEYIYKVSIVTRGRDVKRDVPVESRTESYISVLTPLIGRARCTP